MVSSGIPGQKAFSYNYDELNRLEDAFFMENTQGTWNNTGTYNENIRGYDLNGNLQGLIRNGLSMPYKATNSIDILSYSYEGNRLKAVDDAITIDNVGDFYDNGQNFYLTGKPPPNCNLNLSNR